jgi:hypothetical protein
MLRGLQTVTRTLQRLITLSSNPTRGHYAEKSDGLVPLNRSKWYNYEGFSNPNAAASSLTRANVSFDGAGEADGGYNNGEMRDLVRRYGQHQSSKPMQKAKAWMDWYLTH